MLHSAQKSTSRCDKDVGVVGLHLLGAGGAAKLRMEKAGAICKAPWQPGAF